MDIKQLRQMGYSYKAIAEKLDVSINTVKSYCRRNNLGEKNNANEGQCAMCGAALTHVPHKKKKKFCSDACRMKWWNENKHLINRKSKIELKCGMCGKVFSAYGKAERKYCSHDCYIKARFGYEKE